MNTESVDCVRLSGVLFPERVIEPGEFVWAESRDLKRTLYIVLPGECHPCAIPCQKGPPGGDRVWGWDGNEEKPTLDPSINYVGHWHGWLRAGRLVSC